MVACPNKSHPDWIKLEKQVGRQKAIKMYVDNGFEIPQVTTIPTVATESIGRNNTPKAFTMSHLNQFPREAKKIIDKLKSLYPNVRVYKDEIINENGEVVKIPARQSGMHYRNAFVGAVAWANDSYLETPPHEYAHDYIDMFRDHPLVQEGIAKYGEEGLVTMMGKYFAGRELNSNFRNWVVDFFDMIRSLFGHPTIADELSKAFHQGKRLSLSENSGTAIYRFQSMSKPETRIKGTFDVNGEFGETTAEVINDEEAAQMLITSVIGLNPINPLVAPEKHDVALALTNFFNKLFHTDLTYKNREYKNISPLPRQIVNDCIRLLKTGSIAENVGKKLFMEEVELSEDEQLVYDTAIKAQQRLEYMHVINNSLVTEEGKIIPLEPMKEQVVSEINTTADRRKKLYQKMPKRLRSSLEFVEKKLLRYNLVPRIVTKYLSGSEQSWLSKIFYKSLDHASKKFAEYSLGFDDRYSIPKNILKNWSNFNKPKQSINDYETIEIDGFINFDKGNTTNQKIKLTKAEALTLYLNYRQNDDTAGSPPPAQTLKEKGFHIDELIKDREVEINDVITVLPSELERIKNYVEADAELMELVPKIDEALEYLRVHTNTTYKQETGFELDKVNNYFPIYVGSKSLDVANNKQAIEEIRSGHARLGSNEPLRIADVNKVLAFHKNNTALYASHALPISNNRKLLDGMKEKYHGQTEEVYIDSMVGTLNNLEDASLLFSSQGEKDINSFINKITSNFAVSVLGMNIGTMLKQPIAYLAIKEIMDKKYLKQAGWGIGGIVGIKPGQIWRSLAYTGVRGGETLLPVEWKMDASNPIFKEIVENSPRLRFRLEGATSRETGEALMDEQRGADKIKIPGFKKKDGTPIYVSKHRLMEGIKIFDSATVMAGWKAAKFETLDMYPELKEGSPEFFERVAIRTEEIVAKTQGAFEGINRTEASRISHPIVRLFTMFGSQTSLMGQLLIDGTISYMNNPTKENKRKLFKRYVNILGYTSLALVLIDTLRHAVVHGFDDDDDIPEAMLLGGVGNAFGNIYGFAQLSRLVISRMDSQPWQASMQHPVEAMMDQFGTGLYNIIRGYKVDRHGNYESMTIDDGIFQIGKALFQAKGLPISPFSNTAGIVENVSGK